MKTSTSAKSWKGELFLYFIMIIGALLAAFSIRVFFIPNRLIDGGMVGAAMICGTLVGKNMIPFFLILFNLPFLFLAYRFIGKVFLIHMFVAVMVFSVWLWVFSTFFPHLEFHGEILEVVVIAGAILGIGLGLIIRTGGSLDGTEVLGIILNKKSDFTVGQVVLFCNVFVFGAAGLVFQDWHPPLLSLITYLVVIKVMDAVIVGLDETKSVIVISTHSKEITYRVIHELGLGCTIMYGRGGFSGREREILYVIAERLQLAELKELILQEDPHAFIAIENLHEVANGRKGTPPQPSKSKMTRFMKKFLLKKA